jgi:hypothetical protein
LKELEKRFEKLEKEIIGPRRHEEFHNLLVRLKELYLKVRSFVLIPKLWG